MDIADKQILIVVLGAIGAIITIILVAIIGFNIHANPVPLREVTVCNNINHTANQCYKYWAHIGPASTAN
jgi:putative Ca2+/H+ antiporter (TMEM165/GDT1 family)